MLVVSHDPQVAGVGLAHRAHLRGAAGNGCRAVPTLDEAFDALEGLVVNVEIKGFPTEPDADPERIVARGVVALLERRALYEHAIVSSFELDCIDAVHALDARVTTAWLTMSLPAATAFPIAAERGHTWVHPDRATMLGAGRGLDDARGRARSGCASTSGPSTIPTRSRARRRGCRRDHHERAGCRARSVLG